MTSSKPYLVHGLNEWILDNDLTPYVIDNEALSFSARFNGISEDVYCPMNFVLAIYARENGEGMMFPEDEAESEPAAENKTPTLKLIK